MSKIRYFFALFLEKTIGDLYDNYKEQDHVLYLNIAGMSTFGKN